MLFAGVMLLHAREGFEGLGLKNSGIRGLNLWPQRPERYALRYGKFSTPSLIEYYAPLLVIGL